MVPAAPFPRRHLLRQYPPIPMTTLRPATAGDLPAIFAIYDREVLTGTATCDTQPRTEAERLEWLAAHDPVEHPVLVAEDADGITGWGCLSAWSPRPAYARSVEDTVYVRTDCQGRGLGRRLLARLLDLARERSRALVIARVVEGNPASRHLHEAAGFTTIGVMEGAAEKFGRVLDVRILGLRLRP